MSSTESGRLTVGAPSGWRGVDRNADIPLILSLKAIQRTRPALMTSRRGWVRGIGKNEGEHAQRSPFSFWPYAFNRMTAHARNARWPASIVHGINGIFGFLIGPFIAQL
jgi:hypothetical protein